MGARTLPAQVKAWRARQIRERMNMVWPDLGQGEEGDQVGRLVGVR